MSGAAYVRWFKDIGLDEVGMVGGKTASCRHVGRRPAGERADRGSIRSQRPSDRGCVLAATASLCSGSGRYPRESSAGPARRRYRQGGAQHHDSLASNQTSQQRRRLNYRSMRTANRCRLPTGGIFRRCANAISRIFVTVGFAGGPAQRAYPEIPLVFTAIAADPIALGMAQSYAQQQPSA